MEEKDGIIARFIQIRKNHGPSQEKFGNLLGVSDAAISQIEKGKITINEKHIKLISGVFGINEEWLRTGQGEIYKDGKVPDEETFMKMYRPLSPEGRKMVRDYIEVILKNEEAMRKQAEAAEKKEAKNTA